MSTMIYRFDRFELNARTSELLKSGVRIKLGGQPLEILALLLERPGDLVTREELKGALWKEETFTDFDHGVNTAIQRIRRALGDSAQEPRFIETLPRKGYRFIGTVERVKAEVLIAPSTVPASRSAGGGEGRSFDQRLLWVAPAFAVALAVFYGLGPRETERELPPIELDAIPLPGSFANAAGRPAFSPDGEQIAFTWMGPDAASPNPDIYVTALNSGEPRRLSSDPNIDSLPSWSPDGSTIVWWRELGGGKREIVEASATGGPELPWGRIESVSTVHGDPIVWTADGNHLIYSDAIEGSQNLYVRSRDGGRRRLPAPAGGTADYSPAISPDGRLLAFAHRDSAAEEDGIYLLELNVDGTPVGDPRWINKDRQIWSLSWTADGTALVYQSSRTDRHSLWRVPVSPAGARRQRLGNVSDLMGVSIASTGDRLAFCRSVPAGTLYKMSFDENSDTVGEPERLTPLSDRVFHPHFSPDGRQLAFSENRDLYSAIVIGDANGDNVRRLYSDPSLIASGPRWAPDGDRIAFTRTSAMSEAAPADGVYVTSVSAAKPIRVTGESVLGLVSSWSSDADAVYFASDRTGRHEIWKQSLRANEATQVTHDGGFRAAESPDGRMLYYMKSFPGALFSMPGGGGEEEQVVEMVFDNGFAVLNDAVYYIAPIETSGIGTYRIERYDVQDGRTSVVRELPKNHHPAGGITVSSEAGAIVYGVRHREYEIMLVQGFK